MTECRKHGYQVYKGSRRRWRTAALPTLPAVDHLAIILRDWYTAAGASERQPGQTATLDVWRWSSSSLWHHLVEEENGNHQKHTMDADEKPPWWILSHYRNICMSYSYLTLASLTLSLTRSRTCKLLYLERWPDMSNKTEKHNHQYANTFNQGIVA